MGTGVKIVVTDAITIVFYFAALILVCVFASKRVKSGQDFCNAGKSLTWKVIAGSTISTAMGANMILGKYDLVLEFGLSGIAVYIFYFIGWLFLLFMIKPLRNSGADSIPDFLEKRFGRATRRIGSYCVLVFVCASCAAQILAFGQILNAFGICDSVTGTWIGTALIALFTVFSGLWGVAYSNTIQSIAMLIALGIFFPIAVFKTAGGWDAVAAFNSGERMQLFGAIAPVTMIGWAVSYMTSVIAEPAYVQRILAARSTKDAVKGQLSAWVVALFVCGVFTALPGLAIKMIFPDMTVGSHFAPLFIATYLPAPVRGFMIAMLLSLLLTTGDTYLLLIASLVTSDIIKPRLKKNMSGKRELWMSRLICVVAAAALCGLALYFDTIYQLLKTGMGAYGAGLFIPLFCCFWKRAKTKAVNIGMLTGCLFAFCFDLFLKIPMGLNIDGCVIGVGICAVICIGGSLLPNPQKLCEGSLPGD